MKDGRWYTKFGQFIGQFGVKKLAKTLAQSGHGVTESAVYIWVKGKSQPRPETAAEIIKLADGKLTMDDIYSHPKQMKAVV